MKKNVFVFAASAVVLGVMMASCKSAQSAQSVKLNECEKLEAKSPTTRAVGSGQFFDESTALSIAELQARAEFAKRLKPIVQTATKVYTDGYRSNSNSERTGATDSDQSMKVENGVSSAVEDVVANTVVIHKEKFKLRNGEWLIWVCLEYQKGVAAMATEMEESVRKRISDDDKLHIDFRSEEFRKWAEGQIAKEKAKK